MKTIFICLLLIISITKIHKNNINCDEINKFILESAKTGDKLLMSGHYVATRKRTIVDTTSHIARNNYKHSQEIAYAQGFMIIPKSNYITVSIEKTFRDIKAHLLKKWDNVYINGKIEENEEIRVFDGEKTYLIQKVKSNINNNISITSKIIPESVNIDTYDPRHYGYFICGMPVYDFLMGKFGTHGIVNINILDNDIISGSPCIVVQGEVVQSDSIITVWLSETKMFRPLKIEVETPLRKDKVTIKQKKYNEYIWFPETINFETYYTEKNGDPKILALIWEITVDMLELNIYISDEKFKMKFPKGTKIFDFRTKQILTAGFDYNNDQ